MENMKKNVRRCVIVTAMLSMLFAGGKIGSCLQPEEKPAAAVTEEGFHADILMYEFLMIGSGYLIWAFLAWNGKWDAGYLGVKKGEYAAQE